MNNFVIIEIVEVKGRQKFFKLLNGTRCEFDEFCEMCNRNPIFKKQLATMQTRMGYVADLKYDRLDTTKYRELTGRKAGDPYKDYEIKTKNLRLYFFKDESKGQIVVFGGTKDSQDEDIKRMRVIKHRYFNP